MGNWGVRAVKVPTELLSIPACNHPGLEARDTPFAITFNFKDPLARDGFGGWWHFGKHDDLVDTTLTKGTQLVVDGDYPAIFVDAGDGFVIRLWRRVISNQVRILRSQYPSRV